MSEPQAAADDGCSIHSQCTEPDILARHEIENVMRFGTAGFGFRIPEMCVCRLCLKNTQISPVRLLVAIAVAIAASVTDGGGEDPVRTVRLETDLSTLLDAVEWRFFKRQRRGEACLRDVQTKGGANFC